MKEPEHSDVYLVKSQDGGQRYVLRVLSTSPEVYWRLMLISDPHLPKVLEVTPSGDSNLILEEYIPGDTLAFLLSGSNLSRTETRDILMGLCDALTVLHENGIVHRDIKPENIIIRGDQPVLIDFDAARLYKAAGSRDTHVLGTTGFAAPEQYGISQTDNRADIYAMGVLLNLMLTGQHPSVHLASGAAGRIVSRCTMANPGQRFQTAAQLKARLSVLTEPSRKKYILAGGIVCAVLIAAVAGYLLTRPDTKNTASAEGSALSLQSEQEAPAADLLSASEEASMIDPVPEESAEESAAPATAPDSLYSPDAVTGFYTLIPDSPDDRIADFQFAVTEDSRTVYFAFPSTLEGNAFQSAQPYTGGDPEGPAPSDQSVLDAATFGDPQDTGMPGVQCIPITFDESFTGLGNLMMEAHYENDLGIGGNIAIGTQEALDELNAQNANSPQEPLDDSDVMQILGFYTTFPEDTSTHITNFEATVTPENNTLWFLFPDQWSMTDFVKVDCYTGGDPNGPDPTSQSVLEHITIGDIQTAGISGFHCVPIVFDDDYTGTGNLHIEVTYGESLVGGNVHVTAG